MKKERNKIRASEIVEKEETKIRASEIVSVRELIKYGYIYSCTLATATELDRHFHQPHDYMLPPVTLSIITHSYACVYSGRRI